MLFRSKVTLKSCSSRLRRFLSRASCVNVGEPHSAGTFISAQRSHHFVKHRRHHLLDLKRPPLPPTPSSSLTREACPRGSSRRTVPKVSWSGRRDWRTLPPPTIETRCASGRTSASTMGGPGATESCLEDSESSCSLPARYERVCGSIYRGNW